MSEKKIEDEMEKTYKTRFSELGYCRVGKNWRIVNLPDIKPVGNYYMSKIELLSDLDRYAKEFGATS